MSDLFRVYFDPDEIGADGYPYLWHGVKAAPPRDLVTTAIKDIVREQAGHRCVRCGHPYRKGAGEWSSCDALCTHGGPEKPGVLANDFPLAQWRILTVHHLNGVKHDCRWWNLAALCQRCHLTIQAKVRMERAWHREHSEWFRPYVAGFYAWRYLGEELDREQTMARLDELLALEHLQMELTTSRPTGEATSPTTGERRSS